MIGVGLVNFTPSVMVGGCDEAGVGADLSCCEIFFEDRCSAAVAGNDVACSCYGRWEIRCDFCEVRQFLAPLRKNVISKPRSDGWCKAQEYGKMVPVILNICPLRLRTVMVATKIERQTQIRPIPMLASFSST